MAAFSNRNRLRGMNAKPISCMPMSPKTSSSLNSPVLFSKNMARVAAPATPTVPSTAIPRTALLSMGLRA